MTSLQEMISATTPRQEYAATVGNILRDKAQGWSLDYYKDDGKSSYDVAIARAETMVQLVIKSNEASTLYQKLNALEKIVSLSKQEEKARLADVKKVEIAIEHNKTDMRNLAFTTIDMVMPSTLQEAEGNIATLAYKRVLEKQRMAVLQLARNQFMCDCDEELLWRTVTYAETRFTALMSECRDSAPVQEVTKHYTTAW